MSDTPCQVCGKPGFVQGAPGGAYSGCWCPDHAPRPVSPLYTMAKAVLILAIVVIAAWKLWRRLSS